VNRARSGPSSWRRLNRLAVAARVAHDIPDGYWVNLGIGMPTDVAEIEVPDKEIVFHCENGVLGVGPRPAPGEEDPDLINAGKEPVTLARGGSFMNHADSFVLIRGRHLDLAVLGAFQVSVSGDLANWSAPGDPIPAVGGAMDLAVGARQVWAVMKLFDRDFQPKLVASCSYPLTAAGVVSRVYTELATFHLYPTGVAVRDLAEGVIVGELEEFLGLPMTEVEQPSGSGHQPRTGLKIE
jgi:3-oxoadipate CoA-transferase, beta subunit